MIAEIIPWLIGIGGILLTIALCVGGALWRSGTLSRQEREEMGLRDSMTLTTCPNCGHLHDRNSFFCGAECERQFFTPLPDPQIWPCRGCGAVDWEDAGNECNAGHVCAADEQRIVDFETTKNTKHTKGQP